MFICQETLALYPYLCYCDPCYMGTALYCEIISMFRQFSVVHNDFSELVYLSEANRQVLIFNANRHCALKHKYGKHNIYGWPEPCVELLFTTEKCSGTTFYRVAIWLTRMNKTVWDWFCSEWITAWWWHSSLWELWIMI